jgi:hypothetical protein
MPVPAVIFINTSLPMTVGEPVPQEDIDGVVPEARM